MSDGTTAVTRPPMEASDEATEEQLDLARAQGDAAEKALHHMTDVVADAGGEKAAGDYLVGISVRDGADGRLVPGLEIHATLTDPDGEEVGTHRQPFVWHPWIHHYGRNWVVPGDGRYDLEVRIEAPDFPRHDEKNGKRYAEEITVRFDGVEIETGQG